MLIDAVNVHKNASSCLGKYKIINFNALKRSTLPEAIRVFNQDIILYLFKNANKFLLKAIIEKYNPTCSSNDYFFFILCTYRSCVCTVHIPLTFVK